MRVPSPSRAAPGSGASAGVPAKKMGVPDAESDFNQWLHAMKMVSQLPGGMPPDFRRKVSSSVIGQHEL